MNYKVIGCVALSVVGAISWRLYRSTRKCDKRSVQTKQIMEDDSLCIMRECAMRYASSIFENLRLAALPEGCCYSMAGGMFKSILTGTAPRNYDIFPVNEYSEKLLVKHFQKNGGRVLERTELHTIIICNGLRIMVNRERLDTMREVVDSFDIVMSKVAVSFNGPDMQDCYVDRMMTNVFYEKRPILIRPLPNPNFLLVTAERILRYSSELGYPLPVEDIEYLREMYEEMENEEQIQLWINYKNIRGTLPDISSLLQKKLPTPCRFRRSRSVQFF
eukprot:TRINITY_DN381685_c0_g1_i1.p1 TRINITY_DN381685_c0_g1~~TRINITY_DN381685_c0_g1_i1.p1  ORF type:complete len:275 (-),score=58.66 TRINITY_DN381685_c0_g1_i1:363-1187(-)